MATSGEVLLVRLRGRKVREGLFDANTQARRISLPGEERHKEPPFDYISSLNRYLLGLLLCKQQNKYLITLCYKCGKSGVR